MYSYITEINNDQFCTIWLNRPAKKNALNPEMISELSDGLSKHSAKKSIRAVIIRGKGDMFCSGADLHWMKNMKDKDINTLADLLYQIHQYPKPVITIAHGGAFGGALGIIAASDIVISDDHCRFSFSEVRLGLIPSVIAPFVISKTGFSNTKYLFLTARSFNADEALSRGLVQVKCPLGQLDQEIEKNLDYISKSAPNAVSECKILMNKLQPGSMNMETLKYTVEKINEMRETDEAREGISAFFEKRPPNWYK